MLRKSLNISKQLRCLSLNPKKTIFPSQQTKLSNGLTVATTYINSPILATGVYANCGSRYENLVNNGVAHYFEHLVFKGTEGLGQEELERQVEDKGVQLNAFTSREQTAYKCTGNVESLEYMVKLISNLVQNPVLDVQAITDERSVILREIESIEQDQEETCYDYLHEVCYRDSPLSYTILGPRKFIKQVQRPTFIDFVKSHYIPERLVLAAAGRITHKELCEYGEKLFKKSDLPTPEPPASTVFKPGLKHHVSNSMPNLHVAFATSVSWTNPDILPLMLASQMLGFFNKGNGTHNTYLTKKFEKHDMALSFSPYLTIYNDAGLLGIYLVVDNPTEPNRVKKAISTILKELNKYAKPGGIDKDLFENMKQLLVTQAPNMLSGPDVICDEMASNILRYGRKPELEEQIWRLNQVTLEDVQECMKKYVAEAEFAFGAIGPECDFGVEDVIDGYAEYC